MDVTDVIGGLGPFQRRIFYVVLYRAIPAAMIIFNAQFFTDDVDYWCAREEVNVTIDEWRSCFLPSNSKCEKYLSYTEGVSGNVSVKCDSWEYDSSKYGSNMKEEIRTTKDISDRDDVYNSLWSHWIFLSEHGIFLGDQAVHRNNLWHFPYSSPMFIMVPEVARWLLTVGRDEEAEKTILKAAKLNGIEIVDVESVMRALKRKIQEDELAARNPTFISLFRTATIRRMTIVIYLASFLTTFCYFGFTLNADKLEGSLHMNFFLIGITECVSTGIFLLEAKYMRRRRALQLNYVLTGLSFFVTLAIPKEYRWLRISVALLGQTCNNICVCLLWLLSAEIFPTNLRGVGVSGGMAVGRIGGLISTFMDPLARVIGKDAPIAIFGAIATLTSIIFLLLPETRDKHLPDTVKESERLPESVELNRLEHLIDT